MNHDRTFIVRFLIGTAVAAAILAVVWIFWPHFFLFASNPNWTALRFVWLPLSGAFVAMLFEDRSKHRAWPILTMTALMIVITFGTTAVAALAILILMVTAVITAMILPYPRHINSIYTEPPARIIRMTDDIF